MKWKPPKTITSSRRSIAYLLRTYTVSEEVEQALRSISALGLRAKRLIRAGTDGHAQWAALAEIREQATRMQAAIHAERINKERDA